MSNEQFLKFYLIFWIEVVMKKCFELLEIRNVLIIWLN